MAASATGIHRIENGISTRKKLLDNPHLENMEDDVLFHLHLSKKQHDFKKTFGDVKYVCIGGTARRMKHCAHFFMKELGLSQAKDSDIEDLTANGHRFSMFKAGCVLCVNHGMGEPSIMIQLHEIIKLLHYAEVEDPIIFRIGTSGGVSVPSGTVVIANETVNDFFESVCEVPTLGKVIRRPAILDQNLVRELKGICDQKLDFPVLTGKIMSNLHFYESMASKCASFCDSTNEERNEYIEKLKQHRVLNMDMESIALASLTHYLGVKSAVINVVVNSAEEVQEPAAPEVLREWESRPQRIVLEFIKRRQGITNTQKLTNGCCK